MLEIIVGGSWLIFILLLLITGHPVWAIFALLFAVGMYSFYYRYAFIKVDEMKYGVVFDRFTDQFLFFVDEKGFFVGDEYSKEYKRPQYRHRLQLNQRLYGTISKGTVSASGTTEDLRTKEGFPVSITWKVDAMFDPHNILAGIEFKIARALCNAASNVLAAKFQQELRRLIEEKSVEELYQYVNGTGATRRLEAELQERVVPRLFVFGGRIMDNDVFLGPIKLSDEAEQAVRRKYQRQVETETLEKFKEVVAQFSDEEIRRLRILEALRVIESSEKMVYLSDLLETSNSQDGTTPENPRPANRPPNMTGGF